MGKSAQVLKEPGHGIDNKAQAEGRCRWCLVPGRIQAGRMDGCSDEKKETKGREKKNKRKITKKGVPRCDL